MRRNVLIEVKSEQRFPDDSCDSMDFITVGTFHVHKNGYYIIYKESEITGMEGVTTSLKVEDSKICLNRMGKVDLKQVYELGTLNHSTYVTSYGTFYLGVLTRHMDINLTEQGGRITLKYDLFADDKFLSQNTLRMNIKEDSLNESI